MPDTDSKDSPGGGGNLETHPLVAKAARRFG